MYEGAKLSIKITHLERQHRYVWRRSRTSILEAIIEQAIAELGGIATKGYGELDTNMLNLECT